MQTVRELGEIIVMLISTRFEVATNANYSTFLTKSEVWHTDTSIMCTHLWKGISQHKIVFLILSLAYKTSCTLWRYSLKESRLKWTFSYRKHINKSHWYTAFSSSEFDCFVMRHKRTAATCRPPLWAKALEPTNGLPKGVGWPHATATSFATLVMRCSFSGWIALYPILTWEQNCQLLVKCINQFSHARSTTSMMRISCIRDLRILFCTSRCKLRCRSNQGRSL